MKKKICLLLVLSILILSGCRNAGPAGEFRPEETNMPTTYQTDSANEETGPVFMDPELDSNQTESVSQTESGEEQKADPTTSTRENKPEGGKNENESGKNSDDQNKTSQTEPVKPTDPPVTDNDQTQSSETEPIQTQPKETEPPATTSKETVPKETESPTTDPSATEASTKLDTEAIEPSNNYDEISEILDCNETMELGNSYGASTYGWKVDMSLNEDNSGFHFGSWVFAYEGQDQLNLAAYTQVDFLYREMQSRYPGLDLSGIRFRVHAFACGDGLYEVRVYYA